jgi:hypothetical protein
LAPSGGASVLTRSHAPGRAPCRGFGLGGALLLALASVRQPAMLSGRVLDRRRRGQRRARPARARRHLGHPLGRHRPVGRRGALARFDRTRGVDRARGIAPIPAVALVLLGGLTFGARWERACTPSSSRRSSSRWRGSSSRAGSRCACRSSARHPRAGWTRWTALGLDLGSWGRVTLAAPLFLEPCWLVCGRWGRRASDATCAQSASGLELARLAGVPVGVTRIGTYAVSGLLASAAGIVHALYHGRRQLDRRHGLELDALAAAVVGWCLACGWSGRRARYPVRRAVLRSAADLPDLRRARSRRLGARREWSAAARLPRARALDALGAARSLQT